MQTTTTIPVLSLYGRLLVSLQGDITDSQMEDLTRVVLERIRDSSSEGVVIDASGVWTMDSHLCAMLGKLAAAARLMGAHPVLSGLSPSIVMALQTMGIELDGIDTAIDLESALEIVGLRLVAADDGHRHEPSDDEAAEVTSEPRTLSTEALPARNP